MKKIFKERPMPDGIEFKEKNYGKTAAVLTAAGGIAAAVGPFAGMTAVSKLDKSFGEDDFVTVLDGAPVTAGGIALDLSPVEADDYLFGCRSGYEVITGAREAFETISARFGEYGGRSSARASRAPSHPPTSRRLSNPASTASLSPSGAFSFSRTKK